MNILGIEIGFGKKKAAQPVSTPIQRSTQKTEPSVPLKSAHPREELGDSGTRILHGYLQEEYNQDLSGIEGIKKFDIMRNNDGTVRAAILVTTLPIRRAKWFINPATEDPKNKEIAEFVEHALFDWIEDMTWDDVIRQALLMVPFGVMLFEKVYTTYDHEGKTYITIKKLAPRLPRSIQSWELADGTFGIQQIRQDGILAQIPGSKLLIMVNEREGDNWWGRSMIRAAYKHWYYKDNFYKIDAIAFERQGLGVPYVKMPVGYTANDEKKAVTLAQNMRANESAYAIIPNPYEVGFLDMGSKTTRDPEKSINHHNKEILQSVLAQFLELGATRSGSGSRALSEDHSDLFLKAEEAIANTLTSVFNKDLIKELVDLNFNDVTVYPVLDYSGITKVDVAALGTAYAGLVTAGAINPTDGDEQYLRAAMGLPPRSQDDIDKAANDEPTSEEQSDHVDIEDDGEPAPAGPAKDGKVDDAAAATKDKKQTKDQNKKTDKAVKKKPATAHEHRILKRKFDDGAGFMSWRPLLFAEGKVNWENTQKTMDAMEETFSKDAKKLLNDAKDVFLKSLLPIVESGDTKAISDLEVDFVAAYTQLIKQSMKNAYEFGKNTAASEMGVHPPATDPETIMNADLLAQTIAEKTAADIETKAKLSSANALKTDQPLMESIGQIDTALQDVIDKAVDYTATTMIGQAMNTGRNDVFQKNIGMIYALQRSEILDKVTCNFCLSMDGIVISPDDSWASTDLYHTNCRGIWVEILNEEQNPPEITGVPKEISDYYGGQTNELIQPKKPITKEGTLADKYVKQKEAAKKK